MSKSFKVTDDDQALIQSEKDGVYKNEVRAALSNIVKDEFIRKEPDYTEKRKRDKKNGRHRQDRHNDIRKNESSEQAEHPDIESGYTRRDDEPNTSGKSYVSSREITRNMSGEERANEPYKSPDPVPVTTEVTINDKKKDTVKEFGRSPRKEVIRSEIAVREKEKGIFNESTSIKDQIILPPSTVQSAINNDKNDAVKELIRPEQKDAIQSKIVSRDKEKRIINNSIPEKKENIRNYAKTRKKRLPSSTASREPDQPITVDTIINEDKSDAGKEFVKPELRDAIQSKIEEREKEKKVIKNGTESDQKGEPEPKKNDIPESTLYAEKVWSRPGRGDVIKATAGVAYRSLEKIIGTGAITGDLSDDVRSQAGKYGLRTAKHTAMAAAAVARGTYHYGKYSVKVVKDIKKGTMTGKEAGLALLKRGGISLKGSGRTVIKTVRDEVKKEIRDFHGSDDLGVKAITKPKDIFVETKNTARLARKTASVIKNTVTGTVNIIRKISMMIKKVLANPVMVKGLLVGIGGTMLTILMIFVPILIITSIIPVLSIKSEDVELTKTYLYITEKDVLLTLKFQEIERESEFSNINEFHYYLNGEKSTPDEMEACTNADLMLAYFDAKYDDYQLDKFLLFFGGTSVREEIDQIHDELYQLTTREWVEEILHTDAMIPWVETIYHLDVNLQTQTFASYLNDNLNQLMTKEEQNKLFGLQEVGFYTFRNELGNPFIGTRWLISSRFGWRIHPITGEKDLHAAIDIPMGEGTPINAATSGKVNVGYDGDGYGNYVVINDSSGNGTLYAHMSSVAVTNGQEVGEGDVIGYVGTTGSSTGPHLHIEYQKNGVKLNPVFYLYCDVS